MHAHGVVDASGVRVFVCCVLWLAFVISVFLNKFWGCKGLDPRTGDVCASDPFERRRGPHLNDGHSPTRSLVVCGCLVSSCVVAPRLGFSGPSRGGDGAAPVTTRVGDPNTEKLS